MLWLKSHLELLVCIAGLDLVVLLIGLLLPRVRSIGLRRALGWLTAFTAIIGAERLTASEPPLVRMLAICLLLLHAMKGLTHAEFAIGKGRSLKPSAYLAYALLSFGCNPALLERRGPRLSSKVYWRNGVRALLIGLLFIALGVRLHQTEVPYRLDRADSVATTGLLLLGLSLAFHSGLFQLVVAAWRHAGYPARLAFRFPPAAKSLSEFWSARWNLPFVEMTALTVNKPLKGRLSPTAANLAAFAVSGLLHECAISLPVGAGYGLPFAYFALHGGLMRGEALLEARGRGPKTWGPFAHVWVLSALLLPLPLCFHAAFLQGVLAH